ncbi:MAG: hypothetical protein ACFFCS_00265 [Candidatus Hodarchaeota archaeon]
MFSIVDAFKANFYWIDFSIAFGILALVVIFFLIKRINKFTWVLFWIGCFLGLFWELPISISSDTGIYPATHFIVQPPVHYSVIIITHTLWDGGLFLVGVWLVRRICKKPHFTKFSGKELAILVIWGQLSELGVELISTFSGGWEYIPYWWNPVLFLFNGQNITLLPQLIWLAAPIVFYFIAIRLKPRFQPA